jgi:hypothetical protein
MPKYHIIKTFREHGRESPHIEELGTRWRRKSKFWAHYSQGKIPYPLNGGWVGLDKEKHFCFIWVS